jgi:tetratricopeptide (TPR) repeat protein
MSKGNSVLSQYELAQKAYKDGEYEISASIFEELIRANDTNPQYFRQLGNAQRHLSMFDEALASYKKAKELDPSSSKAYSDEGKLYYDITQCAGFLTA